MRALLALVAVALALAGCARSPEAATARHLLRGDAYAARGQYREAAAEYRHARTLVGEREPASLDVRVKLAALDVLEGRRAAARQEALAIVARDGRHVDGLLLAAATATTAPELALEIRRLEEARSAFPGRAKISLSLGMLYLRAQAPGDADRELFAALTQEPESPDVHLALASFHEARGDALRALRARETADDLRPPSLSTRLARTAESLSRLVIERSSREAAAHLDAGLQHQRRGEMTQARLAYEAALALDPRLVAAANNLAYLLTEDGGDAERALQLALRARALAPGDPYVADTLGWLLYQRGAHARALSLLQESAARLPDHPEVHYHLGLAYARLGDRDGARGALSRAVASGTAFPGRPDATQILDALRRGL